MTYKIRRGHKVDEEIVRILSEQVRLARRHLGSDQLSMAEAVHNARRTIKRARAGLRIVSLGARKDARIFDSILRDLGRRLSARRDLDVFTGTIEKLAKGHPSVAKLADLRRSLFEAVERARSGTNAGETLARAKYDDDLDRFLASLEKLAVDPISIEDTLRAVKKAHAKVVEELEQASKLESDEYYHDCRKRVQRVMNQCRIIRDLDPLWEQEHRPPLRKLARALGYHQDLAVLQETIARLDGPQEGWGAPLCVLLDAAAQERSAIRKSVDRLVHNL